MSTDQPDLAARMPRTTAHDKIADVYGEARARCPVQQVTMPGGEKYWAVIGEQELGVVLQDTTTYSSKIIHLGDTPAIPIELDPPEHGDYRLLINRVITPALAKSLEASARRYIIEFLDAYIAKGGGDIVPIAKAVPMRVLCRMLGVSDEDWPKLKATQDALIPSDMPIEVEHRVAAMQPVIEYCMMLIGRARQNPGDDLVSGLMAGTVGDRHLADHEVLQIMMLLLLAGHETTGGALCSASMLLATYPDIQAKLRADPSGIPGAVEESLRVEPPVQALDRICTRDTVLAGQTIRQGEKLYTVFAGANTDPEAFPDPGTFDPTRSPNRHYTFGRGIHTCVGAPIARMEIRVWMEEFLARTTSIAMDGECERRPWPGLDMDRLNLKVVAR